jgi:hypothetical protein
MAGGAMGLAKIPSKTEPRCKICMHPKRLQIEQLLVMRARGERYGPEQKKVTYPYVIELAQELWGLRLTEENIENHEARHFQVKKAIKRAKEQVANASDKLVKQAVIAEILQELNAEDVLDEVMAYGLKNLREEEGASVTVDHLLKATDQKLRRTQSAQLAELVDVTARAAKIGLDQLEKQAGTLVDVEEAEVEEECHKH